VVYSTDVSGLLRTLFEYTQTCLISKQATYKNQIGGFLYSCIWFATLVIWIHTNMSNFETNNLQKSNKWFPLLLYPVCYARNLNTYVNAWVGKKEITIKLISGLLRWCIWFATHVIRIHTNMSNLETSNLQKPNKWFPLLTYLVCYARNLNTSLECVKWGEEFVFPLKLTKLPFRIQQKQTHSLSFFGWTHVTHRSVNWGLDE